MEIWDWLDKDLHEKPSEIVYGMPIGKRLAWWELMVEKIIENRGRITIV
jgi:hypothetical protein